MFSGIIAEIYKDIRDSSQKKHDASKAEIENASHLYEKNYRERHGQLKVFCAGMRKPIPLDEVYVEVQFLDDHEVLRYKSPEEVERAFRERSGRHFDSVSDERKDGTQVANNKQYLMLLGGPGVGKSTFLRKVGLETFKGTNGNFAHKCIPVFLELKRFTEAQVDIEALITYEFEICGFPHPDGMTKTALASGKLLVLFDGLDEVPSANVGQVIEKIGDFVNRYYQNRFIASCRIAAYKGGFTRFTEVEMADFADAQIQAYIKNWFDSTPDPHLHQLDENMRTAEQCWKTLNTQEHQATKELARNPLLLTLLCMVYDRSQNFQRNRASLYEDALNIFLKEWNAEKRVNRGASMNQFLDIADETRMLSEIAEQNFSENRLFFTRDELIAQIQKFGDGNTNTLQTFNAPEIMETILIDQGIFVERVRGSYSFSHLTFQEYLTANYIVGDPHSIQFLVKQHLHDERWREVFLLTAGLMREADDLLEAMTREISQSITSSGLKSLLQWAARITDATDSQYSGPVKRAFAIRQYIVLSYLNEYYKTIKHKTKQSQEFYSGAHLSHYTSLIFQINSSHDLDRHLYQNINYEFHEALYGSLSQALEQYYHQIVFVSDEAFYYHDFYPYIDTDFFSSRFSKLGNEFDQDLNQRIKCVKRIKEARIFKDVDLQRMVQRFNAQRDFIKVAMKGESVEPPPESIHDTWLSVFGIADKGIASDEEVRNYIQYFRAVNLIFACKKAAGRVSPEVWQKIEQQLLTWRTEESIDI